jgi:opacity protein-like surface antigen
MQSHKKARSHDQRDFSLPSDERLGPDGATARFLMANTHWLCFVLGHKNGCNDEIYSGGQSLGYGIGYGYAMGLEGDATMIPLGVSGMYNISFSPTTSLTLEGGIRYVIINSNVKFIQAEALVDSYGNRRTASRSYDLEYDNGILGVINAYFNMEISKGFRLFAGGGYKFDLVKGKVEAGGLDINYKNELKDLQISAGVAWDL